MPASASPSPSTPIVGIIPALGLPAAAEPDGAPELELAATLDGATDPPGSVEIAVGVLLKL